MLVTKIKETRSICPVCFKEIDAVVVEKSNAVYIKKRCSSHGVFFSLLEKNADFYKKLMTTKYNLNKENKKSYKSFMFPLTSDCNMNCDFCYNPKKQKPMKITEVISFIRDYNGQIVRLGGGEPTLYKDIFKIIRTLKKINKKPILITNGIKLKNINYLKRLVDAGLFGVHFSLNSMEKERNKHISDKLSAFANLTKFENLYLIMSTTLERDRPEPTIRQILEFYINNIEHINEWRIRSAVSIGKFRDIERYTTYELVEMVCKAAGKDIKSVIKHYRREKNSHTLPCRMTLQIILFSSDLRDSFIICNTQDFVYGGKQSLVKLGVMLARQFKLRHLFRLAYKTIFSGKLKVMRLEIRSWPTKETLDMMDISLCPSLNIMVNLDGGKCARPFCYSLIMNNKDDADYR